MLARQGHPAVLGLNLPSSAGRIVLLPAASFDLLTDDQRKFVLRHEIFEAHSGSHFDAVQEAGPAEHNEAAATIRAKLRAPALIQMAQKSGGVAGRPNEQQREFKLTLIEKTVSLLNEIPPHWLNDFDRGLTFRRLVTRVSRLVREEERTQALLEAVARQLVDEAERRMAAHRFTAGFTEEALIQAEQRAVALIQTARESRGVAGKLSQQKREFQLALLEKTTRSSEIAMRGLKTPDRMLVFRPLVMRISRLVSEKERTPALVEAMARLLVNESMIQQLVGDAVRRRMKISRWVSKRYGKEFLRAA